jgi:Dolichyl-phosphate-mannose-protein mannosyltransferase
MIHRAIRDFFNRREPGARWMLLLIAALLVVEWLVLACAPRSRSSHWIPVLAAGLALLSQRRWTLPAAPAFPETQYSISPAARRWVWMMAGAITLLAAWPRSARLNHGYTEFEASVLRQTPVQELKLSEDNWFYQERTAAHTAVQVSGGMPGSERAARTIPWIAGLLTIGMVVLLGAQLGNPRAGIAAGLLLSLHPRHVQWSSEISDVTLQQFSLCLFLLLLIQALRTNRWRWWIGASLGLTPFFAGHFKAGIATAGISFISAVVVWKYSAAGKEEKLSTGLRALLVPAVASCVWLLPRGYAWSNFSSPQPYSEAWLQLITGGETNLSARIFAYGLAPLLLAGGLYFMLRQDWRTRIAGSVLLLSLPLLRPDVLPHTFVLLPLALAWCGVGLARLVPRFVHAPVIIAVLCVFVTSNRLHRVMGTPENPMREAIRSARSENGATTVALGANNENDATLHYDQGVHLVTRLAEMNKLTDAAFETDTPLFVYLPQQSRHQEVLRDVADGGRFQLLREFPALNPAHSIRLYEYHPHEQIIHLNIKREKK